MKNILIAAGLIIALIIIGVVYKTNMATDTPQATTQENIEETTQETKFMTLQKKDFEAKYQALQSSGAQLIDVRTQGEWDTGHYQEADALIDFYAADFAEQLDALDKDVQYFIHCRSGSRSGRALEIMRGLGFTKVYDLDGGFANAQDILTISQ